MTPPCAHYPARAGTTVCGACGAVVYVPPPAPEHELRVWSRGRMYVGLVYPVELAPAWHRPLGVATVGSGELVAVGVWTRRAVHVLWHDREITRDHAGHLRWQLADALAEAGLRRG